MRQHHEQAAHAATPRHHITHGSVTNGEVAHDDDLPPICSLPASTMDSPLPPASVAHDRGDIPAATRTGGLQMDGRFRSVTQ